MEDKDVARSVNRKQISKIIIFLLPLIILIPIVNYYVDSYAQCRVSYEQIAQYLLSGKNVVGLSESSYNERNLCLAVIRNMPSDLETIFVGSSRSMSFSTDMLNKKKFYNLGMSGAGLLDYEGLIGALYYYDKLPETIILEINGSIFNEYDNEARYKELIDSINYMEGVLDGEETEYVEKQLDINLKELISPSYFFYNIQYLVGGKRFKIAVTSERINEKLSTVCSDGSYEYSEQFQQRDISEVYKATEKIIKLDDVYHLDSIVISEEYKQKLGAMIDFLLAEGVEIELYIPPYSPILYEYMSENEKYNPVFETEKYIIEYAYGKNILVYGSFNPQFCDLQMKDLYDAYHIRKEQIMKTLAVNE